MLQALIRPLLLLCLSGSFGFSPGNGSAEAAPACKEAWAPNAHTYDFKETYADFQARLKRPECEKQWTVLVYMSASETLLPYALWDLYEMEAAGGTGQSGSTRKADLLVQLNGPELDDTRRFHIFSGPVAYKPKTLFDFARAKVEEVRSPVAEKVPELRQETERERLESFLLWGAENYPAKHYLVIVWGHGQGWKAYPVENPAASRFLDRGILPRDLPAFPSDPAFAGLSFQDNGQSWLDLPALREALASFRAATGRMIDIYASDSSLMQMLEVAYELSEEARFVSGSSQIQAFLGLPYRRIMQELNAGEFKGLRRPQGLFAQDGHDEPYLLARMIPTLLHESLDPRRGPRNSRLDREALSFMTASTISSAETVRYLAPALSRLSLALNDYLKEEALRVADLRFVMQNVPNIKGSAQDLGIFLGFLDLLLHAEREKLGDLSPAAARLKKEIGEAKSALDRSVLTYVYGDAYNLDAKSGLVPRAVSLWLPVEASEYSARREEFFSSRLYQESDWGRWLETLFAR